MKLNFKLFMLGAVMMASGLVYSQNNKLVNFSLNFGINPINTVKGGSNDTYETNFPSTTVNIETHFRPMKNHASFGKFGIGVGVGYHYLTTDDPSFGWLWTNGDVGGYMMHVPLYLSLRYDILNGEKFNPYVKVDNGYNFAFPSKSILIPGDRPYYYSYGGGYFFGIGAGLEVNRILNIGVAYGFMNSFIGCRYRWRGYWYNYRNELTTSVVSLTLGLSL